MQVVLSNKLQTQRGSSTDRSVLADSTSPHKPESSRDGHHPFSILKYLKHIELKYVARKPKTERYKGGLQSARKEQN